MYVIWVVLIAYMLARMRADGRAHLLGISMLIVSAALLTLLWLGKRVDVFEVREESRTEPFVSPPPSGAIVEGFNETLTNRNLLVFKDKVEPIIGMIQVPLATNEHEKDYIDLLKYDPRLLISSLDNNYIVTKQFSNSRDRMHTTLYNSKFPAEDEILGLKMEGVFMNTREGILVSKRAQGVACDELFGNYDKVSVVINVNLRESISAAAGGTESISLFTLYANNITNWKFLEIIVTPSPNEPLGANIVIMMCGHEVSKIRGVKKSRTNFGHIASSGDYSKGIGLMDGNNHTITFVKDHSSLFLYIDDVEADVCNGACFTKNDHYRTTIAPDDDEPIPSTKAVELNGGRDEDMRFYLRLLAVYDTALPAEMVRMWHKYLASSRLARETGVQNLLYSCSKHDVASRFLSGECTLPPEVCESKECEEFNLYNERGWHRLASRAHNGTGNANCMKKLIEFCSDEEAKKTYRGGDYDAVIDATCGWVSENNIDNMMRVKDPEVMFHKDRVAKVEQGQSTVPHAEKLGLKGIALDPMMQDKHYNRVMTSTLEELVSKKHELGAVAPLVERDDKLGIIDYDALLQDTAQSSTGTMPSFETLYNHLLQKELGPTSTPSDEPREDPAEAGVETFAVEEEGKVVEEEGGVVEEEMLADEEVTRKNVQKYKRIMSAYKNRKIAEAYRS